MPKVKPKPRSKAGGPSTSKSQPTSSRIVIPLSGGDDRDDGDNDPRRNNLEAFLRARQQRVVEHDPEPEPIVIPDPASSPPIYVTEWSSESASASASASPSSDIHSDEDNEAEGAGEGEEFILGLASNGNHGSSSTSSARKPPWRPRLLPASARPGPKSRKPKPGNQNRTENLTQAKRAPKPKVARSASASPSQEEGEGSPRKRKRRRKRKLRYTLTKEDLKEAAEALAKALSEDSDDGTDKEAQAAKDYVMKKAAISASPTKKLKLNTPKLPKQSTSTNTTVSAPSTLKSENEAEDERVLVELCDATMAETPITVKISKSSLDSILRTQPSQKQKEAVPSTSSAARSEAAARAWITRRRLRAMTTSRIYKRLISSKGRCQVQLFDMGFIGPRVNSSQYGSLIKALGNVSSSSGKDFRPESVQVRRLVQKFLKAKTKTAVTSHVLPATKSETHVRTSIKFFKASSDTVDCKRHRHQYGLKRVAVKLEDIGKTVVMCPICENSIPIGSLARHKAQHTVRCHYPNCGQEIPLGSVMQHGVTHIKAPPAGPIVCETCGKTAKTKQMMWCHQNTHFGTKPFICTECGDSFPSDSSHRRHMKTLHKKGPTPSPSPSSSSAPKTPKKVRFSLPPPIRGPSSSLRSSATATPTPTAMPNKNTTKGKRGRKLSLDLNPADSCEVEIN